MGRNGNKGGVVHPGYLTDVITDVSLDWLGKRRSDRPFCLLIHHKAPHSPHDPAPRHRDLFKDTVFPEPSNLLDDYKGRAPEAVADALSWSRLIQNPEPQYQYFKREFTGDRDHDTRFAYQAYLRNYLRLVTALDENVGRVLDYLDKSGLAKNTIVVYTSDNGYFLGEHGFYNKMWMYEEGFHIPLIVRMPGGKSGAVNQDLVSMLDLAPTVLDLAGVKVPADIQGCSLKPLLTGAPPLGAMRSTTTTMAWWASPTAATGSVTTRSWACAPRPRSWSIIPTGRTARSGSILTSPEILAK